MTVFGDQVDIFNDDYRRLEHAGEWHDRPISPRLRPVKRIVVRSGIWCTRYIVVRVLPVPGGP